MFETMFLVFAFFSATGSFPIDLLGMKASNVYTSVYCVAVGLYLLQRRSSWRPLNPLLAIGTLFVAWQFASTTWAGGFAFSAYRAFVVGGYVFLALALPVAAVPRSVDMVRRYGQVSVVASALLIVCYVVYLVPGARAIYPQLVIPSLTLQPLDDFDLNDPNIIACALSIGLISALASIRGGPARSAALVVCATAIVLTQSRTALAFLPFSALLAAAATRSWGAAVWSGGILLVGSAAVWAAVGQVPGWNADTVLVEAVEQRLSTDTGSNEDRLERLAGAFGALKDPAVAIFGIGAGGSIASGLEPHNMFITFLLELGVLGFMLFCAVFACTASIALRWCRGRTRFYALWMLCFIFLACLTYWHTRTLWFSLSLVVFSAIHQRSLASRASGAGQSAAVGAQLEPAR